MSSRALRKAQREREAQKLRDQSHDHEEDVSSADDIAPREQNKASAFELLAQAEDGDDADEQDQYEDEKTYVNTSDCVPRNSTDLTKDREHQNEDALATSQPITPSTSKRKKKKKKPKSGGAASTQARTSDVDDIDEALRKLRTSDTIASGRAGTTGSQIALSKAVAHFFDILSVDTHHLNVRNEMKRLFGDISFDDTSHEGQQGPAQRGAHIGLAEAVKGANAAGGAGLPAMIRRRNVFAHGKEDWPKASGGGLSMEIECVNNDGSILFRFVHNKSYQQAQREFDTSVQGMDPNLMVNLLRFNPYHISTLLQVSEIAKQEKDYETAGELLERALFSFGRALHPRFAQAISQGRARLDFRRPENREFYLGVWRYIQNISMRATWRTALEWAKLLLQTAPRDDPYSMLSCIDQFALRSRQTAFLLRLYESPFIQAVSVGERLTQANLTFSSALAQKLAGKPDADAWLQDAINTWPWVAARLCQILDAGLPPPSIWATEAPTERLRLESELYATQAADLWKTPDNVSFLKSAAAAAAVRSDSLSRKWVENDVPAISVAQARHVLLVEKPSLIALLPSTLSGKINSSSDPLPPEDDLRSYETGVSSDFSIGSMHPLPQEIINSEPQGFIEVLSELHRLFEILIPGTS